MLGDICEDHHKCNNARISAGVVYKRKLVAVAVNSTKSDPWQQRFAANPHRIYGHAEILALKRASLRLTAKELAKCTLFVCRLRYDRNPEFNHDHALEWALAKPCEACQRAIEFFELPTVHYTVEPGVYTTWTSSIM